jgi:hypothetical protein
MLGKETFLIASSSDHSNVYTLNGDPIWSFSVKSFMIESAFDYVDVKFIFSSARDVVQKSFKFTRNITGDFGQLEELLSSFDSPMKKITITSNSKWCFCISINDSMKGQQYIYQDNYSDYSVDKNWYDRDSSERLIISCELLLPPLLLTSDVKMIFIRASDGIQNNTNFNGYNIGYALPSSEMKVNITFSDPIRSPFLMIFVLRKSFKLDRLNWWQFMTLFKHDIPVRQRHNYIVEYIA